MIDRITTCWDRQSFGGRRWLPLLVLTLLTFLVYLTALGNGFTNWDDTWYVTKNARIADFSWQGIGWWFTNYYHGQYSPVGNLVTVLLFQVDGLNPLVFHLASVVLHLFNVWLVYIFIARLSGKERVAFLVALFFAIHPLQTESIAWVAAIKIPLYTLFSLVALLSYLRYVETGRWKWFLLAFVPFLLAFGSKEQSVALVGALLLVDYYKGRRLFSLRVLLEKLPWVALAVAMGLHSIAATKSYGIVSPVHTFGFHEQVVIPSYALITYLWKLLIPVGMTAIYPYPLETKVLPWFFYLCFGLVLLLLFLFVRSWNRNRVVVFGLGFFVVNILLVLQVVPVRNVVVADRYVYLPLVGFFFILASYLEEGFRRGGAFRAVLLPLLFVYVVGLSLHTLGRNRVWASSETLWTDVVENQPDALIAWYDLGGWYADHAQHSQAIKAYRQVLRINPSYVNGNYNLANSFYKEELFDSAECYYRRALTLDPSFKSASINLFMALLQQHRVDEARRVLNDLERRYPGDEAVAKKRSLLPDVALSMEGMSTQQLLLRAEALFEEKRFSEAIVCYTESMRRTGRGEKILFNRGNAYLFLGAYEKAVADYSAALQQDAAFAACWYNRGMAYQALGKKAAFCADMRQALVLGYKDAAEKIRQECN
ncbi:MAG: hypothetical protein CSA95_06625 [Bacteroidetes bacterium]|nr:MAG: hypothetical protein CSA95_06625 [Bacteroidota bacterium]